MKFRSLGWLIAAGIVASAFAMTCRPAAKGPLFKPGEPDADMYAIGQVVTIVSSKSGTLVSANEASLIKIAEPFKNSIDPLIWQRVNSAVAKGLKFHVDHGFVGKSLNQLPADKAIVILDYPGGTYLVGVTKELEPVLSNQEKLDEMHNAIRHK